MADENTGEFIYWYVYMDTSCIEQAFVDVVSVSFSFASFCLFVATNNTI